MILVESREEAIALRVLVAATHRIMLYHGTSLPKARKIVREGIEFHSGGEWSTSPTAINARGGAAVYLTSNFDLALRYATGAHKDKDPVVLGVLLTGERRLKRFQIDPMDNPDAVWDETGSSDWVPEFIEDVRKIPERVVESLQGKYVGLKFGYGEERELEKLMPDFWREDVAEYNGFNVIPAIRTFLKRKFKKDRDRFNLYFKRAKENIETIESEYYEVKPDGTIRFDEQFWQDVHQVKYPKRKVKGRETIPPKAIKEVWVPKTYADENGVAYSDEMETNIELLPDESKMEAEAPVEFGNYVAERFGGGPVFGTGIGTLRDVDDAMGLIDEIRDEDSIDEDAKDELIAFAEQAAEGFREDPDYDPSELSNEVEGVTQGFEEYAYQDWGMSMSGGRMTMVKIRREQLK